MSVEKLITENLELWTGAITQKSASGRGSSSKRELTGIKKLRELILELAVRGKLVPQDSNDEPAEKLIEKIQAERARQIQQKLIRRQPVIVPVEPDEYLYRAPAGWAWTRLGNITQINPRNENVDDGCEAAFIPMPLITTSFTGAHDQEVRLWGEIKKGFTHFQEGDIALAKITPCFENSKAAVFRNLSGGIGAGTTELHVARPFGETLVPEFILLHLKSPRFLSEGEQCMTGSAGQKRVPKNYFAEVPLALPPLAEQNRIVQKVDELMALCDRLEQQTGDQIEAHERLVDTLLDTLTRSANATELAENWARVQQYFDTLFTTEYSIDRLKQAILQLAVMGRLVPQDAEDEPADELLERVSAEKTQLVNAGTVRKPKKYAAISPEEHTFELPSGWAWSRLDEVFNVIVDCPHSTPKFVSDGMVCVDTNSFKSGEIITEKLRFVSTETFSARNARLVPEPGDIVFAREGSVGESVVLPDGMECCLGQRVMLFRCSKLLSPHFLRLTISSPGALKKLLSMHKGIGAKHVNVGDMRQYVIALPPAQEQHRIVQKVDDLLVVCSSLEGAIEKVGQIRGNLAESVTEQAVS